MRSQLAASCLVPLTLLAAACGDEATTTGSGGGGGSDPNDPYTLVPAERLEADPATACPAAFTSTAPSAGNNPGFESGGQTRDLFVILPPASFTGPRPLLIGFNGTGETGKSFSDRAKLSELAERGFVVVSPNSVGNGTVWPVWDAMHAPDDPDTANKDLAMFDALVPCIAGHFEVDAKRIYVAGHSAGGIMTNYVLQRRSSLLAGGIVASGVYSLTEPSPPAALDEMFVVVTWGGDNDEFSGGTGQTQVPSINFVEQASLASQFYDAEPQVTQSACTADVGHAWLDELNPWFADALLAHPKGLGLTGVVPAVPAGTTATCSSDPFVYTGGLTVECPTATTVDGCADVCQFYADCGVENATVGGVLGPQLTALGFSGTDNQDCGGCVPHCESVSTSADDAGVLACMKTAQDAALCGPGVNGALPLIDAINACCDGKTASTYCMDLCTTLAESSTVLTFLPTCEALVGG
jgi:poly(3-hydroxybutyrate) depolymerase